VVNALTGGPVRRATVVLTGGEVRLAAESDGEGKFEFTGLPAGSYRVAANRPGFLDRAARRLVTVGSERVRDAEVRLPPAGAIAGRVVDEAGEPADRAQVFLFKQVYQDGRRLWEQLRGVTQTNDRGEYRVGGLKAGRYLVRVYDQRPAVNNRYDRPPTSFNVPVYHPSALREEHAGAVEVGVGTEVGGIDVRLVKAEMPARVRVRGRVTGMAAESGIVVAVAATRTDGAIFGGNSAVVRGPDFAFELNVAPGPYAMLANVYSGGPEAYANEQLLVTGEMSGIVVAMRTAPSVTGQFRVPEEGAALKLDGIRVALTPLVTDAIGRQDVYSDGAGRFVTRPLRPGRYAIPEIRPLPDGCYVREMRLGEREITPAEFELGTSGTLEIVLGRKGATVAGSVTGGGGPTVTLIPEDGRWWPVKTPTDDAGGFRFTGVRPGKYTVFAWEEVDEDLWRDPEYRKRFTGVEVEVKEGEAQHVEVKAIGQ
jgi:protocatechuate 3,4-dioxygenase beta subunit